MFFRLWSTRVYCMSTVGVSELLVEETHGDKDRRIEPPDSTEPFHSDPLFYGLIKDRTGEVCTGETSIGEVCTSEVCTGEISLVEVCTGEVRTSEIRLVEVCTGEVCTSEIRPDKFDTGEFGPNKVRTGEPLTVEVQQFSLMFFEKSTETLNIIRFEQSNRLLTVTI